MKRQRGRGRRSGGGNNPNKHFESNGPDVKIRGSAQQILDKYLQYARDAQTSGDRINAENYLQHAEHYYRLIAAMQPKDKPREQNREQANDRQTGQKSDEGKSTDAEAMNGEGAADGDKVEKTSAEKNERAERGRRRRTKREHVDKEVAEAGEAPETGSEEKLESAVEAAPKPRRRSVRKPKPEAEVEAAEDGVMKTLSRGRKAKAAPIAEPSAEAAPEAAE